MVTPLTPPAILAPLAPLAPLAQDNTGSIFLWALVLIVLLLVGFGGVIFLKRWLKKDDETGPATGFTLSDLRELHRQGKMTDDEYEKAKVLIVGVAKAGARSPLEGRRAPATSSQPNSGPGPGPAA